MSLKTIGQGLKTRLETLATFKRVYSPDETPDVINELPCAVILISRVPYDVVLGNDYDIDFRVLCLLGTLDKPSSFSVITELADPSGVPAAIYGDVTLGGTASDVRVTDSINSVQTEWTGKPYLSSEFHVTAYF